MQTEELNFICYVLPLTSFTVKTGKNLIPTEPKHCVFSFVHIHPPTKIEQPRVVNFKENNILVALASILIIGLKTKSYKIDI